MLYFKGKQREFYGCSAMSHVGCSYRLLRLCPYVYSPRQPPRYTLYTARVTHRHGYTPPWLHIAMVTHCIQPGYNTLYCTVIVLFYILVWLQQLPFYIRDHTFTVHGSLHGHTRTHTNNGSISSRRGNKRYIYTGII